MVAEVIVNSIARDLNKEFDYIVPKELENKIKIGALVIVPFGKKITKGFVVGLKETSKFANKEIIELEENYLTEEQIKLAKLMSKRYFCNLSECIKLMLPPGILTNTVQEKTISVVSLNKDVESTTLKGKKQIKIIEILKENKEISIKDLEILAQTSRVVIKALEKKGYIKITEKQINRNLLKNKKVKKDSAYRLNEEQKKAFKEISEYIDNNKNQEFLLYGVTGSGKTEVYLQLIEKVLNKGRNAIMLVPEISLTPQTVNRFIARFGEEKIAVLHSKLSAGERYDNWQKVFTGEAKIVIGARSALFAPIKNIGIIIIDEEHDLSYKADMQPRYNAKDIARYLCKKNNVPLVLGSATPDLTTYYKTKNNIKLLKLTKRANNSTLPQVEIINLRDELAVGNQTMISRKLYSEISENIKTGRQTILFLNRRGYSTYVMCMECGYTVKCNNCNITLTHHLKENKLRCHYCGYETSPIKKCPECNSDKIKYMGTGTQKLETEIKKMFPEVTTIRMDVDTVTKKDAHEKIIEKFKNENINILIGTQMVVKGHHFPNVTLVGVILADNSLNIEDYRASERTFQLLTQVAGRAGRENLPGKVIIQTYNPDSYSIEYAKEQDYDLFYNTEIKLRNRLKYPPFCDIILFNISSENENDVKNVSKYMYDELIKNSNLNKCEIYKPLEAPINKIKNKHRWRIIIKCKLDNNIVNNINEILNKFYSTKFKNTSIIVDVNPTSML